MATFKSEVKAVLFMAILIGFFFVKPFYFITPGYVGFHLRLGKLISTCWDDGIYFKFPLLDTVTFFSMQNQCKTVKTEALTRDLQTMYPLEIAINYRIEDPEKVFRSIGENFADIILIPYTMESVKATIALYNAEEFIMKRNEAQAAVCKELRERLHKHGIYLTDVNFVHTDFTDEFIHAVERKQVSEQQAKQAKFTTEIVREHNNQVKIKAEAEAYALQQKREVLTPELIEFKKVEMIGEAITKWNGSLPRVFTGDSLKFLLKDK